MSQASQIYNACLSEAVLQSCCLPRRRPAAVQLESVDHRVTGSERVSRSTQQCERLGPSLSRLQTVKGQSHTQLVSSTCSYTKLPTKHQTVKFMTTKLHTFKQVTLTSLNGISLVSHCVPVFLHSANTGKSCLVWFPRSLLYSISCGRQ